MTHPGGVRRICLIAAAGGDPADAGSLTRCKDVLDRVLRSAGADGVGTWRQDRGGRQVVLLPIGTAVRSAVPLLIQGLREQLGQDRPGTGASAPRPAFSLAQGTVTQARGGYAGQAIVTASRLLDSADLRAALSGTPDALFALIVSDDLYAEAVAQGSGTVSAEGFRRVTIDAPDNLWQGVGWIRAWGPASPAAQSEKKEGDKKFPGGLLSGFAGALNDVASIAQSGDSLSGSAGADAHAATADTAHLTAAHASAAEHAYGAEQTYADHYIVHQGPGYLEETVVHSGYEGGTGYEDGAGYDSADYHSSSGDHSGGVV
jgi:hypothetical protein